MVTFIRSEKISSIPVYVADIRNNKLDIRTNGRPIQIQNKCGDQFEFNHYV